MFFEKSIVLLGFALLAVNAVSAESDLDRGLAIMACARRAMAVGVPELGVPPHDPYVVITRNFSFSADIGSFLGAKINMSQMTWAGLARWNLTATQLSLDDDDSAAFHFKLYWDYLKIAGHFDLQEDQIIFHPQQHGQFSIEFEDTDWKGTLNVTKPNKSSNGTVNESDIHWHAKDVKVHLTGLGLLNTPTAALLQEGLENALNRNLMGNLIGKFIKMRLETVWWNTGKVWQLTQWCKDHPEFSEELDLVY
ncbi:unnamed protein product [Phyllotreta striolata]|uniref:Uncharacterized protein n=1 Tax=Phyllotreta striolata TaxID=444603 RepID=A0A9N9TVP7_PHYSR|nr:unnamed protein product [Phyllotreta striolata]